MLKKAHFLSRRKVAAIRQFGQRIILEGRGKVRDKKRLRDL